jgi:Ni/Co efflux regulator RcnB
MFKHLLAAAVATALLAAPAAPAFAQKAKKELTPQQQKMKDCGPKWAAYKKEKNIKGRAEHNKFMSTCLKG